MLKRTSRAFILEKIHHAGILAWKNVSLIKAVREMFSQCLKVMEVNNISWLNKLTILDQIN